MADTPSGGIPLVPTIGTLARQLQGLAGQMHGARNDLDGVAERLRLVQQDVAALKKSAPVPAPLLTGTTPPGDAARPSLAAQAMLKTVGWGKYGLIALGALGVASQVAAQFKPGLVGPIQTLIQLLQALGGQ